MFVRRELALSNYDVWSSAKTETCHEEQFFKIETKKFNIEKKKKNQNQKDFQNKKKTKSRKFFSKHFWIIKIFLKKSGKLHQIWNFLSKLRKIFFKKEKAFLLSVVYFSNRSKENDIFTIGTTLLTSRLKTFTGVYTIFGSCGYLIPITAYPNSLLWKKEILSDYIKSG